MKIAAQITSCLSAFLPVSLAHASPAIAAVSPGSVNRPPPPTQLGYETTTNAPAYIYHNAATGERIVLTDLPAGEQPRGTWLWSNAATDPCSPPDYYDHLTIGVFSGMHSESDGDMEDPFAVRHWHDWLEHPGDSVIYGFTITTFAQIVDTDDNFDGVGDGIEGLDLILVFTEQDDPDDSSSAFAHSPIIVESLPGSLDNGSNGDIAGDGVIGFQEGQLIIMYVDLLGRPYQCADDSPVNASIEIGDTDGVPAVPNINFSGVPGADTDGDGLINTGFIIGFRQPGVAEGDGLIARFPELAGQGLENPDGYDLATFPAILPVGVPLKAPSNRAESYIDGEGLLLQWPSAPGYTPLPGEGTGASDSMLLIDALGNETGPHFFGGFACDPNAIDAGVPPFYVNPWTGCDIRFNVNTIDSGDPCGLGRTCNPVSCFAPPFDVIDLADIGAFLQAFLAGDSIADLAPPECIFDLADLSWFIAAFQAGCP